MNVQKKDIKILIIDDEKAIRDVMAASIKDEGYTVATASDGKNGLELIQTFQPRVVFCDIWMNEEMEGLDVLRQGRSQNSETEFVMMSGHGTIETAVRSTKLGAWDFVEKPLSMDKVLINIVNIVQFYQEKEEKSYLLNKLRNNLALIGESSSIVNLKQMIARWAPSDSWLLLCGEAGSGKSLVAEIIHYFSERAAKSIVEINMNKVPVDLHEAELFGIEAGSFPGVQKNKKGKLELADHG
ncbi:MAG TPA: response regulator, partial [Pseudobdellovibrionaceae bacterium]|nr:response regulator [Pseudobdellovibrionaceae bacterium]